MVLDSGARLAKPGEFTERAFLNHKMDLSQAEAVYEIISNLQKTLREKLVKFYKSLNLS